ncbi:MAG: DUF1353 domain-containing protein [Rhodobacterales bacterium]|nr:DUF1353 domain-containing protein [Rhodobacterales bacterium]
MLRSYSSIGVFFAVSACVIAPETPTNIQLAQTSIAISHTECQGSARPNCAFFNGPVQLQQTGIKLASRKATFFQTASQLDFVDARANRWIAPKDTLTDGASIPDIFVSLIGNPTSPEFINASTIHDAYCGIGNENGARYHTDTWQNVHRMFYDALRVGGTTPIKAKIMFSAVYLGGPRWASKISVPPTAMAFQGGPVHRANAASAMRSLGRVPTSTMVDQLKAAISFINKTNPTLAQLEIFLIKSEARALAENGESDGSHSAYSDVSEPTHETDPTTDPNTDPTNDPATTDPNTPTTGADGF